MRTYTTVPTEPRHFVQYDQVREERSKILAYTKSIVYI